MTIRCLPKKYSSPRSYPPYPASKCGNKIMTGNDGKKYISILSGNSRGKYKWVRYNVDKKSRRDAPKRSAPKRSASRKAAPKRSAPKRASRKVAPKRSAPKRASRKFAPKRSAPKRASRKVAPKRSAPKRASRKAAPKRASRKAAPKRSASREVIKRSLYVRVILSNPRLNIKSDKEEEVSGLYKLIPENHKKIIDLYKELSKYLPIEGKLDIKYLQHDHFMFSFNVKNDKYKDRNMKDVLRYLESPDSNGNHPIKVDKYYVLVRGMIFGEK